MELHSCESSLTPKLFIKLSFKTVFAFISLRIKASNRTCGKVSKRLLALYLSLYIKASFLLPSLQKGNFCARL